MDIKEIRVISRLASKRFRGSIPRDGARSVSLLAGTGISGQIRPWR
jgi:hypothetical protein